jgi:hypothetical protein
MANGTRRRKWMDNPDDWRNFKIPEEDLEWVKEKDKKYKYHVTVTHKPTGMTLEQAGERSWFEATDSCMQTLRWRLANWDEYVASRVRPIDD